MASAQAPAKPRGLLRLGYRLPIALYRANLGWLLGHRFLLLTHRGRKSGAPRQTVLEVVRYDPARRESAVVSAYGDRADWYQNILASPPIEVQTGRDRYAPRYRLLAPDERLTALSAYRKRYPGAFAAVMRFLGFAYDGTESGLPSLADQVIMVAFRPRESA
ncbi:MAG TPA: nitroreductase family deazaflavin-dependent oxidoreductase [Ktedonobacterales bacterium]|nr:nitroreductase family deazaflavin-dependent oxidoreductase [Ktedonobacterales bacterium]